MISQKYDYLSSCKSTKFPSHQLSTILDFFEDLQNIDVMEIGIGNITNRIEFAKLFRSYTAIEPNGKLFELSTKICINSNSNILLLNIDINNIDISKKYDIIIFINVFHLLNYSDIMGLLSTIVKPRGIILIEEPFVVPSGWGSKFLNKDSEDFDLGIWTKKRDLLKSTKKFLLESKIVRNYFEVMYRCPQTYILIHN